MLESLYNAAYLAIFLSFARRAVNKLALDRSHYYVVIDVPGDPLVILAVAKDDVKNAKPLPIARGMGKGGHIRYLDEPAILKMARKQNRRVLTVAEAEYEKPHITAPAIARMFGLAGTREARFTAMFDSLVHQFNEAVYR